MSSYLTLSIIRYKSRISGAIQGKEWHSLLHLGVVSIEKGPSGYPWLWSANLLYVYIHIY